MNIAGSLVESYMYADMYNREYEGGSDVQEKIHVGGFPVENISGIDQKEQDGGKSPKSKDNGPFSNKVVPVGLVLIQIERTPNVEYEDHYCPGMNREVVPDDLYDRLMGSLSVGKLPNSTPAKIGRKERTRRNKHKGKLTI